MRTRAPIPFASSAASAFRAMSQPMMRSERCSRTISRCRASALMPTYATISAKRCCLFHIGRGSDEKPKSRAFYRRTQDGSSIKFAWPLLKDMLRHCQCVISGIAAEIEPYVAPLSAFGTYWNARHRAFMSATVTDDAFLVKGVRLSPETITGPLSYAKETWSGEKMVLIPSLINGELDRERIVKFFGPPNENRRFGRVALVPGFGRTKDWESYGASIANKRHCVGSDRWSEER